ncbi:hypothetical protein NP493_1063g00028 [Ridgeia piscesae]|uniref:Uncharacterized protein n=1 Tax=Ridgeia piscesae TaxID=27915 RepID=A0AAD9KHH8_RIDPI|nr:hypothetical protein NP493_1063g00028 [Ridgeia piscesae]
MDRISFRSTSACDHLSVPEPGPPPLLSPSTLSVPGESRRGSSQDSSIFDYSYEAEELEKAVRDNNVTRVARLLHLHMSHKTGAYSQRSSYSHQGSYSRQGSYSCQGSSCYSRQSSYSRQGSYSHQDSSSGRQRSYSRQSSYNRPSSSLSKSSIEESLRRAAAGVTPPATSDGAETRTRTTWRTPSATAAVVAPPG